MPLNITNRCMMLCQHCQSKCEPEGIDISMKTLDEIIQFINNPELQFRVVLISGGDPTEHPRLFDILDRLYDTCAVDSMGRERCFTLATNGMFLNKNKDAEDYKVVKDYIDRLLSYKDLYIQITADPRFYKIPLNERNLKYLQKKGRKLVLVEHSLNTLGDYGRARHGEMPEMTKRQYPHCFNARSMIVRSGLTFPMVVERFETKMDKYCAIGVDMLGNIRISESLTCPHIGTVRTPFQKLTEAVRTMDCQGCSHTKQLTPLYRNAIGL